MGESTPHARGSTSLGVGGASGKTVYPACAGIHPYSRPAYPCLSGLPRMRGDPPFHLCVGG